MSDDQLEEDFVVPGRECGACTACCKDLAIVEAGFKKLPGVECQHCTAGSGCAIYATRPQLCRSYHCGWRSLPNMDESWRPDRSGVLITLDHRAEGGGIGSDANLILVGDPAVIAGDRFAGMTAGFIASGTATFLVLPGPPGMMAYHVRLNELLGPAIAARDLAEVKAVLGECLDTLRVQPPVRIAPELMGYAPAQASPV
jgi:hypothetical protein